MKGKDNLVGIGELIELHSLILLDNEWEGMVCLIHLHNLIRLKKN